VTAAAATAPANAGARQASLSVLAAGLVLLPTAEGTSSTALALLAAERGGALGAVYFVNYADLGVPVIGAGVLSPWTGRRPRPPPRRS
jgi:hypothetical protein